MAQGLATQYAPSYRLIRAHFGLSLLGLCALAVALVWFSSELTGFYYAPVLLGLVHLTVLGWLLPVAVGALHQMVPVVFEVPVRSERLAFTALGLYTAGGALFIARLWTLATDGPWLPAGALACAGAVWLYAANLVATLAKSKVHSLAGTYVMSALVYLLVAVTLGAMLAWHLWRPFLEAPHLQLMRAHAHLAGFGFFGLLVMGIAYRLLEMFLLSSGHSEQAGVLAFFAANVAVLCLAAGLMLGAGGWLLPLGVFAAAAAVAAFLGQIRAIWRRRMQKKPDIAWRHTLAAFVYLALATVAGGAAALAPLPQEWVERLVLVYGLWALLGFLGSVVVGQLYKIVPFLVWLHRFSPLVGLKQVPTAAQLLAERPKQLQFALHHAALAVLVAGVLADSTPVRTAGAALFAASAALVAANLWRIDSRRP